ncbi:putative ribonuclease H-like domain-containing protein, partial [Tanacetum coccineum]
MKKIYYLVVTDDYSRFSWVFFLATKDETSEILKTFITGIENLIDLKVKVIRCDNGNEFKNKVMNQFYEMKGIKREFRGRAVIKIATNFLVCRKPVLSFMRPFGCPVTILNTIDYLGMFDGKADEGFFVGYSTNSKAFRTVVAGNQSNGIAGTKAYENAGKARVETVPGKDYILLPFLTQDPPVFSSSKDSPDAGFKPSGEEEKKDAKHLENEDKDNVVDENIVYGCVEDPNMPNLEEIVYSDDDEDVDAKADMTNLDTHILVSPTPTTRIHKDHPLEQIIRDKHSAPQTKRMTKSVTDHGVFSSMQQRINHKDFQNYLFAYFLSQVEPKKVIQALTDPSWIEAMQDKLLQFKLQKVWTLDDLPYGKRVIGTKWIYRNKKDERGIVVRNKAKLVAQGYTQRMRNRIERFLCSSMDVKSAFLYGKIKEEVYVCQPLGFEDPEFSDRRGQIDKNLFIKRVKGDILLVQVYVDDIIFGSTKKSLCTEFEKLMHKKFQMSSMGELTFFLGLQVTQKDNRIFISQDKYVDAILKKFGFSTMKTASTPMETSKSLIERRNAEISMIGSLMYLTSSGPDIMFVVCACARFQVTPKVSHLHAVKRIFRYLKGQPKLGLWYPKDSPFDLEAYTDSDYAGASLDRKSTTGGCQFLGRRLISWQCKKQTIVASSTTKAEYVAASSSCGQCCQAKVNAARLLTTARLPLELQLLRIRLSIRRRETVWKRVATTDASLDAEQDNGNVIRTQSMATLNKPIPQGTGSSSGPRHQDTILGDRAAQTKFERLSKQSNDPPLSGVNTPESGEDRL